MARETRRDARPGAGPGRGTPRARASSRARTGSTSTKAGASTAPEVEEPGSGSLLGSLDRGLSVTRRVIALVVVLALLTLSYASSLRIYFTQQQSMATKRAEIAASNLEIYELQDRIKRWEDPNYVKAQARERLGWVVPGETGYVVLGADGKPIDGSTTISRNRGLDKDSRLTWWQQIWDSMVTADQVGAEPAATARPAPTRIEAPPTPTASPS